MCITTYFQMRGYEGIFFLTFKNICKKILFYIPILHSVEGFSMKETTARHLLIV